MACLVQICFDNSARLARPSYLFEYSGVRFKLVQHDPRRYPDHLLTIVPKYDPAALKQVFAVAAEFLSALAWENNARVTAHLAGGAGWPDTLDLKETKPNIFVLPRIPVGYTAGYHLSRVPLVCNQTQRTALSIFREATASNSDYLSFLFYWQVLEIEGRDPVGFINKVYRKHPTLLRLTGSNIGSLPLAGRSLGVYLSHDCRDAIAHLRRKPGKKSIELDNLDERTRLRRSVSVVRAFAQYYIREILGLKERLYLVRRTGDCPVFADQRALLNRDLKLKLPRIGKPLAPRGLTGRLRPRRNSPQPPPGFRSRAMDARRIRQPS